MGDNITREYYLPHEDNRNRWSIHNLLFDQDNYHKYFTINPPVDLMGDY